MKNWTTREVQHFLGFWLQAMSASERLLDEAAIETDDPELKAYYKAHRLEEQDHAKWLLEDLEGKTLPIHPLAVAIAGSQYYLIKHVHPAVLLGYMLALENPMSMADLEELEEKHGPKLLRTIRHHVLADVGHRADLLAMKEKQTAEVIAMINWNTAQTLQYLHSYRN